MSDLAIDPDFTATRDALHRVTVHVVARARVESTGRFSLRVAPGGPATPDVDERRVRIADGHLLVESDVAGAAAASGRTIDGATLRELAELAGVDLTAPIDVGHDTPLLGDVDDPIAIDERAAAALGRWYGVAARALDLVVVGITAAGGTATLPRLWPEHFDVAIETEARPGVRVNLGASPGDQFCEQPYWYVGPWNGDRPGDPTFWNAPFGAYLPADAFDVDEVDAGRAFLLAGLDRLR